LVKQRGFVVISISSSNKISFDLIEGFFNRVTSGDLTNFTRQLATMANAGLPITESLLILRSESKGIMQKIVSQILADVEEGQSLSSGMSKHPTVFSRTYIALIKSGETGGVLEEVLVNLADNLEKTQEFKSKVKGALIYPIVIILGMVAVAFIMMIFVIPRMMTLYEQFDADLPLPTKILMFISTTLVKVWPLLIILFVVLAYLFKVYKDTPKGKRKIDEMIFKIPLIGDLQRQIVLTDLTRTMSLMVASGISIVETLKISGDVSKNQVITDAMIDVTSMVEKGFPMAFSFARQNDAFPLIFSQMVAVGEETGKMDEVLKKVSHVFEVQSETKLKAITAAIEPIILVVLGVGVAFLVIAVIMPIYTLTTKI